MLSCCQYSFLNLYYSFSGTILYAPIHNTCFLTMQQFESKLCLSQLFIVKVKHDYHLGGSDIMYSSVNSIAFKSHYTVCENMNVWLDSKSVVHSASQ